MHPGEGLRETVGLGIDDEIDVALAIERHVLGAVPGHGAKAQALEQLAQRLGVGRGVFDEFETIGGHGIGPGLRRVFRIGGHGLSPRLAIWNGWLSIYVGMFGMSLLSPRHFRGN